MEEGAATIRGLRLAYCRWRNGVSSWRALAVHGWRDNAASFEVLAPLLKDGDVAAMDLAGHGVSEHRPPSAAYNIWDDLPDLLLLADHLGWKRFHLIGHSKGAAIAALLAIARPERVERLIMLEGALSFGEPPSNCADQLRRHLRDTLRTRRQPPCYDDVEAAVTARVSKMPLSREAARRLVRRGTNERGDGGVEWRGDARVADASAMKFSETQIEAMLETLSVPSLLIRASSGFLEAEAWQKYRASPMIRCVTLPGDHHFHMQEDKVGTVARETLAFIDGETK